MYVHNIILNVFGKGLQHRDRRHAEGGFADLVAWHARLAAGAGDDQHFADALFTAPVHPYLMFAYVKFNVALREGKPPPFWQAMRKFRGW